MTEIRQLQREIAYPAPFYPGVHVFPPYSTVQELQDLKKRAIAEGMSPQDAETLITWRTRSYLPNEEACLQELTRILMDVIADNDTYEKHNEDAGENYMRVFIDALPPEHKAEDDPLVERIAWQFFELYYFIMRCFFLSSALLQKEPVRVPRDTGDATRRGSLTDAEHTADKTQTPTSAPGRIHRIGSVSGTPIIPKTYTDYVNDMIQELTNLPRFTAYAKVLQEQDGKQTVLRRKIHTRPLPLPIQPAEGMAEIARRKAITHGACREHGHIEDEIRTRQEHWRGAGG